MCLVYVFLCGYLRARRPRLIKSTLLLQHSSHAQTGSLTLTQRHGESRKGVRTSNSPVRQAVCWEMNIIYRYEPAATELLISPPVHRNDNVVCVETWYLFFSFFVSTTTLIISSELVRNNPWKTLYNILEDLVDILLKVNIYDFSAYTHIAIRVT